MFTKTYQVAYDFNGERYNHRIGGIDPRSDVEADLRLQISKVQTGNSFSSRDVQLVEFTECGA